MTAPTPRRTINLATLYDEPEMPWSRAAEALGEGSLGPETAAFLSTVRPDGRPHSAGVGVCVLDGTPHFTSSPRAVKARNLEANPSCTLSMRLDGIDLVLEGRADRVKDHASIDAVTAAYAAGGWPARRDGDAITADYSAQSAGPPPWWLFRMVVARAIGVGLRPPHGASSWRF
jgi:hypothetical protein